MASDVILPAWATSAGRNVARRGRPYRAEVVEAVRALLGTKLRFAEIAERTGVGEATVGRWSRLLRFAAEAGGSAMPAQLSSPAAAEQPGRGSRADVTRVDPLPLRGACPRDGRRPGPGAPAGDDGQSSGRRLVRRNMPSALETLPASSFHLRVAISTDIKPVERSNTT